LETELEFIASVNCADAIALLAAQHKTPTNNMLGGVSRRGAAMMITTIALAFDAQGKPSSVEWHYREDIEAYADSTVLLSWGKSFTDFIDPDRNPVHVTPRDLGLSRITLSIDTFDFEVVYLDVNYGLNFRFDDESLTYSFPKTSAPRPGRRKQVRPGDPRLGLDQRVVAQQVRPGDPRLGLDQRVVAQDIQNLINHRYLGKSNTCDVVTDRGQRCGGLPVNHQCRYYCKKLLTKKFKALINHIPRVHGLHSVFRVKGYTFDVEFVDDEAGGGSVVSSYSNHRHDPTRLEFKSDTQLVKTVVNMILKKKSVPHEMQVTVALVARAWPSLSFNSLKFMTHVGPFPARVAWHPRGVKAVALTHTIRW